MNRIVASRWKKIFEKALEYRLVKKTTKYNDFDVIENLIETLDGIPSDETKQEKAFKADPEVVSHWSYLTGVADTFDETPTALLDNVDWGAAEKAQAEVDKNG